MLKLLRNILLLKLLFLSSFISKGQEHIIYNDTNVHRFTWLKLDGNKYFIGDFKDSLLDGKWIYYRTNEPKKKNIERYLDMEGEFQGSLRHGKFIFYHNTYNERKYPQLPPPYIIVNYSKGILDGEFIVFNSNGTKIQEGFFVNGKREGFFIDYFPAKYNNQIGEIYLYKNDSLVYSAKYDQNGRLKLPK